MRVLGGRRRHRQRAAAGAAGQVDLAVEGIVVGLLEAAVAIRYRLESQRRPSDREGWRRDSGVARKGVERRRCRSEPEGASKNVGTDLDEGAPFLDLAARIDGSILQDGQRATGRSERR